MASRSYEADLSSIRTILKQAICFLYTVEKKFFLTPIAGDCATPRDPCSTAKFDFVKLWLIVEEPSLCKRKASLQLLSSAFIFKW